ncbi:MAG: cytochrome c [Bacteroidota bacterium]
MLRLSKLALLATVLFITSCGGETKSEKGAVELNSREKIRLRQYQVQGAKVYTTYCANCHQQDGSGLAALYPPLAGADYLLENLPRAACIIKHGQAKEIVVNGVTYNQMMPGNPISNLEIAEVLTYITNAWGNEKGLIGVKDVDKWIKECESY